MSSNQAIVTLIVCSGIGILWGLIACFAAYVNANDANGWRERYERMAKREKIVDDRLTKAYAKLKKIREAANDES